MSSAYLRGPEIALHWHKEGCTGKSAYASRADALRVVNRRGLQGSPYICKYCRMWHNGRGIGLHIRRSFAV